MGASWRGDEMKIENWMVTTFGIVVAAVVTLIVNYQNRKQARQNELFRKDPSVGLIPPLHPWVAFLQKNWYQAFYFIGMIYYFCRWTIQEGQHSYQAGVSAALFVLYFVFYLVNRLFSTASLGAGRVTQVIDWISEDTNNAIKVLSVHNAMLVAVIADLESRGLLSEDTKAQIRAARSVKESTV